jgi:hypothetical protein
MQNNMVAMTNMYNFQFVSRNKCAIMEIFKIRLTTNMNSNFLPIFVLFTHS